MGGGGGGQSLDPPPAIQTRARNFPKMNHGAGVGGLERQAGAAYTPILAWGLLAQLTASEQY